jgi:hypothetical protein
MDDKFRTPLLWIIGALGFVTLLGSFIKMRGGFESPANTRLILGVLVFTLLALFSCVVNNLLYFGLSFAGGSIIGIGTGYLLRGYKRDN